MSHTTRLKSVVIKDVNAMKAAVAELKASGINCDLVENTQPRLYYQNQTGKCDYVLRLNESRYDVGFEKQKDGSYVPVFDEHGHHVANQIGAACPIPSSREGRVQHQIGKFQQAYAKNAAINSAVASGYMVELSTIDAKGNVHLTLAGM